MVGTTHDCDLHGVKNAIRIIVDIYQSRECMLFANNPEQSIPATDNGRERFLRKVRTITVKCPQETVLSRSDESLALFQNTDNPEYVRVLFGSEDLTSVFGRPRKLFLKNGMTGKTYQDHGKGDGNADKRFASRHTLYRRDDGKGIFHHEDGSRF